MGMKLENTSTEQIISIREQQKEYFATGVMSDEEYQKARFEPKDGETLITLSGVAGLSQQYDNTSVFSVQLSDDELTDGDGFVITLDINTTDTEVKSPYAVFSLPHGIKLTNSSIISGDGKVFTNGNNAEIYYSGDSATVQFTCYAAVEGSYTIQAPVLIDRAGDKYMCANDTVITVK